MYPFERFAPDAKRTLQLAQEEAERAHHSYIGTEHLLLGLLRLDAGAGPDILRELGVDLDQVRMTIATVIGRNERIIVHQIIPTSRVKAVIEIAFTEARRMGGDHVDSGHLLMALAIEGEGIAAHVLEDLGAPATKVVAAVERKAGLEPSGRGKRPQPKVRFPGSVRMRLAEMRTVAGFRQPKPQLSDSETLLQLLSVPQVGELLSAHGLDLKKLAQALTKPPNEVATLRGDIAVARAELANAVGESDFERAGKVQKRLETLTAKLGRAEAVWFRSLGR